MSTNEPEEDLLEEYDFRGGERGRYAKRLEPGYTITVHRKSAPNAAPRVPAQNVKPAARRQKKAR